MANPLTNEEIKIIKEFYPTEQAKVVLWKMHKKTGIYRQRGVVYKYAADNNIKKVIYAGGRNIEPVQEKGDTLPMKDMKIAVKQFDLLQAMSHIDCNAYKLAKKIKAFTGYNVIEEQVIEMQTTVGLPERYATKEVMDFLFPKVVKKEKR